MTFANVNGGDYDIKNIIPCDTAGDQLTNSKNKILVQKMDLTTGDLTEIYKYTTASNKGWCDASGNALDDGVLVLKSGEAICVSNNQGADITLRCSGEVVVTPVSTTVPTSSYALIGNMTPVAVDLKNIIPCDDAGDALTNSKNKILVQKMDSTTGDLGDIYKYTTASGKGWCDAAGNALDAGIVILQPGEAVCVGNNQGASITLKFPSPVTE